MIFINKNELSRYNKIVAFKINLHNNENMAKINLDALIPREDFDITANVNQGNLILPSISIFHFSDKLFYPLLRKPDFQRETNEWDGKKICDFIESFISGDLIPSIILWRSSSGLFFVIDGSHRLSALLAWVNDDYGDGEISNKFYSHNIPEEQKKTAEETRKLVNSKIGSYQNLIEIASEQSGDAELLQRVRNLGAYTIQILWVPGDASKAESSFFKINEQGTPLNETEKKLLKSRKKPNCIAARAIIRAGKGHKYWSNFSAENQVRIQELSGEINSILFSPTLQTPIKTLDLPIGGKISSAQTLPLILDFVNISNGIGDDFAEKKNDDNSGDETIKMLHNARKIAWRINSVHPSSLGLHPIVYFYSKEGRHKPSSFYAIVAFVIELENKNLFNKFIEVRKKFEDSLVKFDYVIQQINRKYRSSWSSYIHIKEFLLLLMNKLKDKDINESIEDILKSEKYSYLSLLTQNENDISSKEFSSERKSAIFIKEALSTSLRCKICEGYINKNSITIDHKIRKEDGGLGNVDNGQLTHPYCNSTYKN